MQMTKHATARFKPRQKIKNNPEMMRKFALALERGSILDGEHQRPGTICYVFDGYKYIVSEDREYLITVIPAKKPSSTSKRHLIDEIRVRQNKLEARLCLNL